MAEAFTECAKCRSYGGHLARLLGRGHRTPHIDDVCITDAGKPIAFEVARCRWCGVPVTVQLDYNAVETALDD